MTKLSLGNKELTLFIFGCGTDKELVFKGYKHRKAVITLLNEKYEELDYKWDEEFWGPVSGEYDKNLFEYNFYNDYSSSICYEKFQKSINEPIHHKSRFLISGFESWVNTYNKIKENIENYQDLIYDAIVYFNMDSSLAVNESLFINVKSKKPKRGGEYMSAYPLSWKGEKPSNDEISWLKNKYTEMNISIHNSPLKLTISPEVVSNKFSYLNPKKESFDKINEQSSKRFRENLKSSPFLVDMIESKIIDMESITNVFDTTLYESKDHMDRLYGEYIHEIKNIQKLLADKQFILSFSEKDATIEFSGGEVDASTYRYCWHILQPLELIHYKREMKNGNTINKLS